MVIEAWFAGGMCESSLMWLPSGTALEIFDAGVGFS